MLSNIRIKPIATTSRGLNKIEYIYTRTLRAGQRQDRLKQSNAIELWPYQVRRSDIISPFAVMFSLIDYFL